MESVLEKPKEAVEVPVGESSFEIEDSAGVKCTYKVSYISGYGDAMTFQITGVRSDNQEVSTTGFSFYKKDPDFNMRLGCTDFGTKKTFRYGRIQLKEEKLYLDLIFPEEVLPR